MPDKNLYDRSPGPIKPHGPQTPGMKTPGEIITTHPKTEVPEMPLDQERTKPATRSLTVDASAISIVAVAAAAGLNLLGAETTPHEIETLALSGIATVAGVVAIVGRIRAKKAIKGVV